jgi:hypothetical protein
MQSVRTPTAAAWLGAIANRDTLSVSFTPLMRGMASGSPIRSIPPSRTRRSDSFASNTANLMLDEPAVDRQDTRVIWLHGRASRVV